MNDLITPDTLDDYKNDFGNAFAKLPEARQEEIMVFYCKTSIASLIYYLVKEAKEQARDVIDYADRRGYGYGEVGHNLNEAVKDFAEEVPELEKQYKRLVWEYFNLLVEAKEA